MNPKLLVLPALLIALAPLCMAQNFVACIYDDGFQLRDACIGGNPLPDGTPGYIYWDQNGNGPDSTDQLAPMWPPP